MFDQTQGFRLFDWNISIGSGINRYINSSSDAQMRSQRTQSIPDRTIDWNIDRIGLAVCGAWTSNEQNSRHMLISIKHVYKIHCYINCKMCIHIDWRKRAGERDSERAISCHFHLLDANLNLYGIWSECCIRQDGYRMAPQLPLSRIVGWSFFTLSLSSARDHRLDHANGNVWQHDILLDIFPTMLSSCCHFSNVIYYMNHMQCITP